MGDLKAVPRWKLSGKLCFPPIFHTLYMYFTFFSDVSFNMQKLQGLNLLEGLRDFPQRHEAFPSPECLERW